MSQDMDPTRNSASSYPAPPDQRPRGKSPRRTLASTILWILAGIMGGIAASLSRSSRSRSDKAVDTTCCDQQCDKGNQPCCRECNRDEDRSSKRIVIYVILTALALLSVFVLPLLLNGIRSISTEYLAGVGIGAGIVSLALLVPLILSELDQRGWRYPGALVFTAIIAPQVAVVATVGLFILFSRHSWPDWLIRLSPVAGGMVALLVWMSIATVFRPRATYRGGSPANYAAFQAQYSELRKQFTVRCVTCGGSLRDSCSSSSLCDSTAACKTIKGHLDCIAAIIRTNGSGWAKRDNYMQMWIHLHRAQEELVFVDSKSRVVDLAIENIDRLRGESDINNKDDLVQRLQVAISALGVGGEKYQTNPIAITTSQPDPKDEAVARAIVQGVHRQILTFRDEGFQGLLWARNQLITTSALTWIVAYVFLALVLLEKPQVQSVVGASSFFLIGSLVGLFAELKAATTRDKAVDDYGLSTARVASVPLFSGIAGLAGVFLVAFVPSVIDSDVLAPSTSTATREEVVTETEESPPVSTATVTAMETSPSLETMTPGEARSILSGVESIEVGVPSETAIVFAAVVAQDNGPTATHSESDNRVDENGATGVKLDDVFDITNSPIRAIIAAFFGLTPSLLISRLSGAETQFARQIESTRAGSGT